MSKTTERRLTIDKKLEQESRERRAQVAREQRKEVHERVLDLRHVLLKADRVDENWNNQLDMGFEEDMTPTERHEYLMICLIEQLNVQNMMKRWELYRKYHQEV